MSNIVEKEECPICIHSFTRGTHKAVECTKCQYKACTLCVKRYLTESLEDSHCMNCHHSWDKSFMTSVLPTSFLTRELKNRRRIILFQREQALFQETIPFVEAKRKLSRLNTDLQAMYAQIHLHYFFQLKS